MSKILLLYGYNKYNNRIIKKKASFADYQALITPANANTPAQYKGLIRDNVNFDYQDGVHSILILNVKPNDPTNLKLNEPDYLVLLESIKEGSNTVTKLSRWFVLDANRIRGNQYKLSLRRDLLADYYNEVLNAPVFIEKGTIVDIDDPLLFNRESMSYNQIKKKELLLNNNIYSGKNGWIVGYLARTETATASDIVAEGQEEIPQTGFIEWNDIDPQVQAMITAGTADYINYDKFKFHLIGRVDDERFDEGYKNMCFGVNVQSDIEGEIQPSYYRAIGDYSSYLYFRDYRSTIWDEWSISDYVYNFYRSTYSQYNLITYFNAICDTLLTNLDTKNPNLLNRYNNIIYRKEGKFYKLSIIPHDFSYNPVRKYAKAYTNSQLVSGSDALAIQINSFLQDMVNGGSIIINPNRDYSKIGAEIERGVDVNYTLISTEVTANKAQLTIPATRNKLYDAPYDMFCIPYGNVKIKNGAEEFLASGNVALPIARSIALQGTTLKVYDIQILPYCPLMEAIDSNGDIDLLGLASSVDYSLITEQIAGTTQNVSVCLYPKTCKGTFDFSISAEDEFYPLLSEERNSVIEKKIKSETQFARFVSPNFSSIFEIDIQKNKGIINLNVDFFYKPYAPYIHVAPYFSGLYGEDYNDPKGLICSGDFSIATASSKWEEYEIQNKNYQEIFRRGIQNLDINNSLTYNYTQTKGIIDTVSSGIGGGIAGAGAGAVLGSVVPGIGTVAGAVVGGVAGLGTSGAASVVGLKYDLEYLANTQQEARSYAVDMYGYNLGNIKALPDSLTRVSAFTQNFKIFPFIEFYDCTIEEKEALRDKLKYNGMTIMKIGKIADYIVGEYNYVQGKLIRLLGIDESNHVIAEIAKEIKQGAYYYGYTSES